MPGLKNGLNNIYTAIFGSYPGELRQALRPYTDVLDVGCGGNSPITPFARELAATGVDGFAPSIEASRQRGTHKRYLHMDLKDIARDIPAKSFDCVLCSDVIEHFEKAASRAFVAALENIAKKRVVLFTPNGYIPQGPVDGNEFQIHRCGWNVEELTALGYAVTGVYGHKALRGELAAYKIRPAFLGRVVSDATQFFVRTRPRMAFALLAVKNL